MRSAAFPFIAKYFSTSIVTPLYDELPNAQRSWINQVNISIFIPNLIQFFFDFLTILIIKRYKIHVTLMRLIFGSVL